MNHVTHTSLLPVVPMFHVNGWGVPYAACIAGCKLVLPGSGLSLSLALPHSLSLSLSPSLSLSRSRSHTLSGSLWLSLAFSRSLFRACSLSFIFFPPLSLSPLSLSPSCVRAHACSLFHRYTVSIWHTCQQFPLLATGRCIYVHVYIYVFVYVVYV